MMMNQNDDARLRIRLEETTRTALSVAGLMTAILGVAIVAGCLLANLVVPEPHLKVAAGVAMTGFALGLSVYLAAQRDYREIASFLVVGSTILPTAYFLLAEQAGRLGGTSGLLGPVTMLYAFFVASTGFLLRPSLPLISGASAAIQLLGIYVYLRADLQQLPLPSELRFEVTEMVPWIFRSLFLFSVGVAGWATSRQAQRLLREMLAEQRENLTVSHLFGQFVSTEVRDKILSDRANLHGERKEIAILFSDIRGFTSWSEKTAPADVVSRLNQYFEAMVEEVEAEGGVVDKFIGDAIMVTFGGLVPAAEPASAAIRSAIRMQKALERLNRRWAADGMAPFSIGIGISYGPVIQGPLGGERRRDFTVIGDVVNTASRLESLTKEARYPVLVSQAVVERLPANHGFLLVDLGMMPLRGKAEPLGVWGLRG